ncbi:MAG: anti-sigma factor antagonist [Acidobacteria bacterium]|nr:anti-sigma factor antagonist [Acidobacteriota bacterium]
MNVVSKLELPDVETEGTGASFALKVSSDLLYENAHEVVEEVYSLLTSEPKKIVLDLADVGMIDSSGLKALLQSQRLCEKAGAEFELRCVSACVARVIRLSGFQGVFSLQDSRIPWPSRPISELNTELAGWRTFERVVSSDPAMISVLREQISEAAVEAGARDETLCDILIAVGEALTNAYKHGSPKKRTNTIQMRCTTTPKAVVVEIRDQGMPFDPDAVGVPNPKRPRDHGMGIYLMRQTMDSVEFACNCPGNSVRMIKWLQPRPEPEAS